MIEYSFDNIPLVLRNRKQWIVWREELNEKNELTKVPYQAKNPKQKAGSTLELTWSTFEDATKAYSHKENKLDGIGFCFNGDRIFGIDLDGLFNKDQSTDPIFKSVLELTKDTYREISPSGEGIHCIFRCDEEPFNTGKSAKWNNNGTKKEVAIFCRGKYFTFTGKVWGESKDIATLPADEVRSVIESYLPKKEPQAPVKKGSLSLGDKEILNNARAAKNGQKFSDLYDRGNWEAYYPSQSEGDSGLAALLLFYSQDVGQVSRMMQASALNRGKWGKQPGYLTATIEKARSCVRETYSMGTYREVQPSEAPEELEEITEEEMRQIQDKNAQQFKELPDLPEGFFRDYVRYGERMSYAYPAYHFGTALALVSLVAGRKVVMQSTGATIYPNVFVLIVGQTSTSGKSTACDLMYNNFFGIVQQPGVVEDLTKKMSPQGLLQRLSKCATRLWYYDECSEFFSDIQNRWAESLESIMCSVYDGRSVSYGLSEGKGKTDEYRAQNVFLTCLWNTTTSEMETRAKWEAVTNGFLPRWMFFWCHTENKPRKNREITAEDIAERTALEVRLQKLRGVLMKIPGDGMIRFKPHDLIESWKLDDNLKHLGKDDELHRIASARLVPQAYKIAVLFSLMDEDVPIESGLYPLDLKIPDQYAKLAIQISEDYLRPRLMYVIELSRNNDTKNLQNQVIRALTQKFNGCAKRSAIMKETKMNKRNFNETIESLVESETLEEKMMKGTGGRNGIVLKLISSH